MYDILDSLLVGLYQRLKKNKKQILQ